MPIHQFAVRAAGTVAALALSLTLAACGGNASTTPNSPAGAASTAAQPSQQFNDKDVRFTQMMIPHHRQAIAMAEMATDRAQSPDVKALAQQIKNEQDPEIQTMTGFLKAWGAQVPQHGHFKIDSWRGSACWRHRVLTYRFGDLAAGWATELR